MSAFPEELVTLAEQEVAGLNGTDVQDDLAEVVDPAHPVDVGLAEAADDVDNASEAVVSLESYFNRFMDLCPKTEWNRQVATQYELGARGLLAARGITVPSALYAPSFESAEAVDETGTKKKTYTKDEHYEEVQGRTRAFLTRIYEALKAAIKKFFGWLNDWQHRQRTNAARLRKAADSTEGYLKARLGLGYQERRGTVVVKDKSYLEGGDESLKGTKPSKALQLLVAEATNIATDWNAAYETGLKEAVAGLKKGAVPALTDVHAKIKRYSSVKFPGGIRVETIARGDDPVRALAHGKIEIAEGKPGGRGEIGSLPVTEIRDCLTEIRAAAKYMEDSANSIKSTQRDVDQAIKGVQDAIDKAKAIKETSDIKTLAQSLAPIATRTTLAWRELNPLVSSFAFKVNDHCHAAINGFMPPARPRGR